MDLGRAIDLEKSSLSRNVRLLEDAGWVRNVPSQDGRGQELSLTDDGEAKLDTAMPAWRRAQKTAVTQLGPEATELLDRLLEAMEG